MLKIQEKSKPETAIWLTKEDVVFSNDGKSDLLFETAMDALCKAKLQLNGDKVYLADLSFNFPITLNQHHVAAGSKVALKHGDCFTLGNTAFEIIDPKCLVASFSHDDKQKQLSTKAKAPELDGHKSETCNNTEKRWVTKPTSVGNRSNDSLDIILAEHRRKKKLLNNIFAAVALAAVIALIYWLS